MCGEILAAQRGLCDPSGCDRLATASCDFFPGTPVRPAGGAFSGADNPEMACDLVTLGDGWKILPVPLLDRQYQGGGGSNSNSPRFFESDVSSELEMTPLTWEEGGMRPFQPAAASPRCATTSPAFGRSSILPSQQRWVNTHSESESPIAEEFSGLVGRFPRST